MRTTVELIRPYLLPILLVILTGPLGCQSRVKPLMDAIEADDAARVRELLAGDPTLANAAVMSRLGGGGQTRSVVASRPLHTAAEGGHAGIVEILLEHGAEVDGRAMRGETALHRAAARAKVEAMEVLLARGAAVNDRDEYGATPLHHAMKCGCRHGEHVELLLSRGAVLDTKADGGKTPLHWSAEWGSQVAGVVLCAHGVAIDARDDEGRRALDIAEKNERGQQVAALLAPEGSCRHLAALNTEREAVPEGELDAVMHELSCELGLASECTKAASLYQKGDEVAGDPERAATLYRKAAAIYEKRCREGKSPSCTNLGVLHARGRGVARDDALAVSYYVKGCEGGNAAGCSNLGAMYRDARSVPADRDRAAALFEQACQAGFELGCRNLEKLSGR
jgi:hypothetical protein